MSSLPLNRLERLEWKNILWYPHKKMLLIGYQNRIDSKRSHPAWKFWKRKKCPNSNPCSARPNSPLRTRIRAVDWCWECCDICWRTMGVWVYMRWRMRSHSEHGMGHMWALEDSPAAGATRYGHGLTRKCTREKTGRRTRLWRYISGKVVALMFIEISGVVVELRWRYHNI